MRAYDVSWFRGYRLNERTIAMILTAEKAIGKELSIFQGSYNAGGVSASAGTHDGGGAVDCWLPGGDPKSVVRKLRAVGFAAWYRPPIPNVWGAHIHAIAIGDRDLSGGAKSQVTDYYNHLNGLASHAPDNTWHPDPIPVFDFGKYKLRIKVRRQLQRLQERIRDSRKTQNQLEAQRKRAQRRLKHLKTH